MGCAMRKIEAHEEFVKEFEKSVRTYSIDLKKKLYIFSEVLKEKGMNCIIEPAFGEVRNSKILYELRLKKRRPNLRVLFVFSEDTEIVLMVRIFYEKNTLKDYDRNIPKAEKRAEEWFKQKGKNIKRRS